MKKEEALSLIRKKRWNICSGPANLINCYGFMIGFMKMKKYYKEYYKEVILAVKDKLVAQYTDEEQNFRNIRQLYDEPEKTRNNIKRWLRTKEGFYKKFGNVQEMLEKSDENGLLKEFKVFVEDMTETWAMPLATDAMGLYTETELLDEFKDAVGKKDDALEMFSILSQPSDISFVAKEHISLLNLAILHKQKSKEFEKELKRHQRSYFWIENNYKEIKALDEAYFLSKVMEEEEKGLEEINNEIRRLTDKSVMKRKQEALLEELNLAKGIKEKVLLTQDIGIWNDHRKEFNLISNHYLSIFLKEFSRRLDIPMDDLHYLLPDEIEKIMGSKIVPKDTISKRKKAVVHIIEQPQKESIFQGDDALEIFRAIEEKTRPSENLKEIKGIVASKGKEPVIKGKVKIVLDPSKSDFQKGDILVASMTRPEYVPLMRRAKAIITDEGGITCHAAIVSRELGIPCIIGTKNATKMLHDGDLVEIKGNHGLVIILEKAKNE